MSVNWKLGMTPISELTLENFRDFARDYAAYTYMLCYKATLDEKQSVSLSANTLAAVACKEAGKEGSDKLMPEEAIKRSLLDVLTKQQLAQLNNDDIKAEKQLDDKTIDAIVDKAVNLANMNMPRYARVFSGTKGTLVILGLVAVLVAAIILIWINPNACNAVTQTVTDGKTGNVSAAARPDTDMLVNVDFDDTAADGFNSGAYPVLFSVSGPDSRTVTDISVFVSAGVEVPAYPCGEYTYGFVVTESDVYQVLAGSEMGMMSSYCMVPPVAAADGLSGDSYYVVSHNDKAIITIEDGAAISLLPARGVLENAAGAVEYTPADDATGIGLDRFSYVRADGTTVTVPVLVSNTSPYIDPAYLNRTVTHTPSKSGMLAGSIVSQDADGDEVTFSLSGTEGCSAMLSSDGSYVVLVEPEYRLGKAGFSFTVSDGIIESDPYTVDVYLLNNLISATELSKNFVCYSGENGYYEFALPEVDDDGDRLTWSLVTEQTDGLTSQWGSSVAVTDGNIVRYRINPSINDNFVEILTFACSDGWMNGTLMTVVCNNSANRAPVSSGNNSGQVKAGSVGNVLEVSIDNDCPFDRCVISSVDEVVGGSVKNGAGWSDLKFEFTPDGSEEFCVVRLTVSDTVTNQSVQIVYDITVQ